MTLSTIQRRYDLTGIQSGLIVSVFDMAVIVSVIFISYFGGKGHKPRWLGVGLLVQGLGKQQIQFIIIYICRDSNHCSCLNPFCIMAVMLR